MSSVKKILTFIVALVLVVGAAATPVLSPTALAFSFDFHFSIPSISIPSISIPTISIPDISIPTISIPDISISNFDMPQINSPTLGDLSGLSGLSDWDFSGVSGNSGGGGTSSSSSMNATSDITKQMADNSAAWYVAKAVTVSDTATPEEKATAQKTMDKLHETNTKLANVLTGGNENNAKYDPKTGSWEIKQTNGTVIKSSNNGLIGQATAVSYCATDKNGSVLSDQTSSSQVYAKGVVDSYLSSGGTPEALAKAYNTSAKITASIDSQGLGYDFENLKNNPSASADAEASVVQAILGLTDEQRDALYNELFAIKTEYNGTKNKLSKSELTDEEAAAIEKELSKINAEAQGIREKYGYSGNYNGSDSNVGDTQNGGFFIPNSITYTVGGGGSSSTPTPDSGETTPPPLNIYTITATAERGGTISPSGYVNVLEGSSKSFTIGVENENFTLQSVLVDGKDVGAVTHYVFENVTAPHTIKVIGKGKAEAKINDVDILDPGGKVIGKDGSIKSGYGIEAKTDITLTNAKIVEAYATMSNGDRCEMELVDGELVFVKNKNSKINARRYYIPVETKDGKFDVTIHLTAVSLDDPTFKLTDSYKRTIIIKGSMYEDDFTGDR